MMQSNRMLQREQVELLAIEKKLLKVVPVIQEALNSLKVEELHLKSLGLERTISESQQVPPSNRTHFDVHETPHMSTPAAMRPDQINQQKIDLDLFISKLEHDEELDSD